MIKVIETNAASDAVCQLLTRNALEKDSSPIRPIPVDSPLQTKFIYASFSEAFPGSVKIGRTANVKTRLSSGNVFCAPMPHRIIAVAPTLDAERDEDMAFGYFAPFRIAGEFFTISHEAAVAFLANHVATRYFQEMHDLSESVVRPPSGSLGLVSCCMSGHLHQMESI